RPMAKPPVRKLAKDLGVDLAELTGSGPEGTITREDVQAAAGGLPVASAPPAQPALAATAGGGERVPIKGGRKHTAAPGTAQALPPPPRAPLLPLPSPPTTPPVPPPPHPPPPH